MPLTERAGYEERPGQQLMSVPIAAAETIFDGALVEIANGGGDSGRALNWNGDTLTGGGQFFAGIARITELTGISLAAGESKTGDTAGVEEVSIDVSGVVLRGITVAGTSATSVGFPVYASDENTFSITQTPGGNAVGLITRHITGTTVDVQLFSFGQYMAGAGAGFLP